MAQGFGQYLHDLFITYAPAALVGSDLSAGAVAWAHAHASAAPLIASVGAAMCGALGVWAGWSLTQPSSHRNVVEGRKFLTGQSGLRAVQKEMTRESKWSGRGIHIHPKIQISRDRETRGVVVVGAIGSGKTVVIKNILKSLVERGDRCLIYDNKGDFTSEIASIVDPKKTSLGLVAPWDKRSMRWSVARDVRSVAAARELASRLIPEPSSNAQWAQGAQLILSGLIVSLARDRGCNWSWADLAECCAAEYPTLRESSIAGQPLANGLLPPEPTVTTASYLANLTAAAGGLIADLAAADAEAAERSAKSWNARDWVTGKQKGPRIVVLQDNEDYKTAAQALGSAVIRSIRGALSSMPESKTNRTWLVLDEFPQLGRVQGIDGVIDTGRSKGVCVLLGFQTRAKIADLYGEAFTDALLGNFGTQIICRSGSAETRRWAADQIGTQKIRQTVTNESATANALFVGQRQNQSTNEQYVTQNVVWETDVAGLGRRGDGINAILVTGSANYVCRVWWPFPTGWKRTAKPHVPARWTTSLSTTQSAQEEKPANPANPDPTPPTEVIAPTITSEQAQSEEEEYIPDAEDIVAAQMDAETFDPDDIDESATDADDTVGDEFAQDAIDALLPGAGTALQIVETAEQLLRQDDTTTTTTTATPQQDHTRKRIKVRKKQQQQQQHMGDD